MKFLCILKIIFIVFFSHLITNMNCQEYNFGVALTTIPPRFDSIQYTINSWFHQTVKPKVVFIFVPEFYFRFSIESEFKPIDILYSNLVNHFPSELHNGTLQLIEIDKDFGPISKYLGLLNLFESLYNSDSFCKTNEFIQNKVCNILNQLEAIVFGDDDVSYTNNLLHRYYIAININSTVSNKTIYYHFAPTQRIFYNITQNNTEVTKTMMHLQG